MNYSEIKEIINDMEESKLSELDIEFPDGTKVRMKKCGGEPQSVTIPYVTKEPEAIQVATTPQENEDTHKLITSPMVGTFYAKPSPNAEPFVEVGSKVKKGDVLCIIEAMKLMNEIESELDGEIAEILVKDGEIVDYGKPLFRLI